MVAVSMCDVGHWKDLTKDHGDCFCLLGVTEAEIVHIRQSAD